MKGKANNAMEVLENGLEDALSQDGTTQEIPQTLGYKQHAGKAE